MSHHALGILVAGVLDSKHFMTSILDESVGGMQKSSKI